MRISGGSLVSTLVVLQTRRLTEINGAAVPRESVESPVFALIS